MFAHVNSHGVVWQDASWLFLMA